MRFAAAYSFKYSPRPGTPAAESAKQVPEEEKLTRLHRLQALLRDQQDQFNRESVGATMPVLVEKPGRDPGQMMGRSPYLQPVHFTGEANLIGCIIQTKITGVGTNSLSGHYARAA